MDTSMTIVDTLTEKCKTQKKENLRTIMTFTRFMTLVR